MSNIKKIEEIESHNIQTVAGKIRLSFEILWVAYVITYVYLSISKNIVGTETTFLEYYMPIVGIYYLITLIPLSIGLLKNFVFEKLKLDYSKAEYIVEMKSVFITGLKFSGSFIFLSFLHLAVTHL